MIQVCNSLKGELVHGSTCLMQILKEHGKRGHKHAGTCNKKATASIFFLSICEVKIGGPNAISGGGNNHMVTRFTYKDSTVKHLIRAIILRVQAGQVVFRKLLR